MIRLEQPWLDGMWRGSEPRFEARVTRDFPGCITCGCQSRCGFTMLPTRYFCDYRLLTNSISGILVTLSIVIRPLLSKTLQTDIRSVTD